MPAEGRAPASPLYERIRTEIALRGWTWKVLTERTGLARSTLNSWKTQPQPPQARAVNAVADELGIGRVEALRLAGILTDSQAADLTPQCAYEDEIVATPDISDDTKRQLLRVHRERGHGERCGS